jgi:hypothetical protein
MPGQADEPATRRAGERESARPHGHRISRAVMAAAIEQPHAARNDPTRNDPARRPISPRIEQAAARDLPRRIGNVPAPSGPASARATGRGNKG